MAKSLDSTAQTPLGKFVTAAPGQSNINNGGKSDSTNRDLPKEIKQKIEGQTNPDLLKYIKNTNAVRITAIKGHDIVPGTVTPAQESGIPFSGTAQGGGALKPVYANNRINGTNILNKYISYNYVVTLSGLLSTALENPTSESFEQSSKMLKILSSSGKGAGYEIGNVITPISLRQMVSVIGNKNIPGDNTVKVVNQFNTTSPGRFDMYIDNIEIDTLMGYSGKSGPTLPTGVRFEVFEPYSMNGFMEALQATALASGYVNYATASYLLKIHFAGYRDTDLGIDSEIPYSTRYFGIYITEVQLDVTEKGTRYICVGIPFNEFSFTDSVNKLRQNVQAKGQTVDEILTNFIQNIQFQRALESKSMYVGGKNPGADTYQIRFLGDFANLMKSNLADPKDEKNVEMENPQFSSNSGYGKLDLTNTRLPDDSRYTTNPRNSVVNFSAQQNITDCIASVISESTWARDLVKKLNTSIDSIIDKDTGFLDYFSIRVSTKNKKIIDPLTNRYYQIHAYLISPYRVHYTSVPGFQQDKFDFKTQDAGKLSTLIFRDYNYIYTGKNVDIIDFKINFKNSFLAPLAPFMGANDKGAIQSIGKPDIVTPLVNPDKIKATLSARQIDVASASQVSNSNLNTQYDNQRKYHSVTANQPLGDPDYLGSKAMYEAILNNPADMVELDLGIIGDPIYVTHGGIANYMREEYNGLMEDGAINQYYGGPLIRINFKNFEDISPDGIMKPNLTQVQFSGIYMVRQVVSKFSNGVFTQVLKLNRLSQLNNVAPTGSFIDTGNIT